jgi:hypothetical protein
MQFLADDATHVGLGLCVIGPGLMEFCQDRLASPFECSSGFGAASRHSLAGSPAGSSLAFDRLGLETDLLRCSALREAVEH